MTQEDTVELHVDLDHYAPSLCTITMHHHYAPSLCTITMHHHYAPSLCTILCTITMHHHYAPPTPSITIFITLTSKVSHLVTWKCGNAKTKGEIPCCFFYLLLTCCTFSFLTPWDKVRVRVAMAPHRMLTGSFHILEEWYRKGKGKGYYEEVGGAEPLGSI